MFFLQIRDKKKWCTLTATFRKQKKRNLNPIFHFIFIFVSSKP